MKIVIIGAGGRLGSALTHAYHDEFEVVAFDREQLDLSDEKQICDQIAPLDFEVLINAAGMTNVDRCETERDRAFRINADAPRILAKICGQKGAKLIHFSTDYVFDGEKREAYEEDDAANPINVYGKSKRAGEKFILDAGPSHLVVRVSWVFGPSRPSFLDAMIERALKEEHVEAIADKFSTPTYTKDIAEMLPRFFDPEAGTADPGYNAGKPLSNYGGILHFANTGECSWQEYAQFALDRCRSLGLPIQAKRVGALKLADMARLRRGSGGQADWIARRPVYSVLSTVKFSSLTGTTPRTWRDAVGDYIDRFYSKK
jgi:dTDP-4-dehydrorhamnose reductase